MTRTRFLLAGDEVSVSVEDDHSFHLDSHEEFKKELVKGLKKRELKEILPVLDSHIEWHKRFRDRPAPSANTNVKRGAPYAVRWRPDMFLTDAFSLEGPQDSRWVAFGWELPLADVQANPDYENVDQIQATRYKDAPEKPEGSTDDDGFDIVRGWEIWALDFPVAPGEFRDLMITVAEDGSVDGDGSGAVFLQYDEEWPYDRLDDYPVEVLSYHSGQDAWYTLPPLLLGGGDTVQALVNEILDSFLSIVRKQKNIWLVDPKLGINKTVIADMLQAPDGSVIEVPGLAEKGAANAILALPFHQVPSDKEAMLGLLQSFFDRSVGTPQPISMPKTDTATEASIIERRNTSRENRRSGLLSEFQTRKSRKMLQLDLQYLPEQLFNVDRSVEKFVELSAEMARGEYMTIMDVTSHSTSMSVERSQYMDLLNLFAGLTPIMIENFQLPPNLPELARRLLVRGFGEQTVEEILPMLEQASAMLKQKGSVGPDGISGPQQGGDLGVGRAAQYADPMAQASQEAVQAGQGVGNGVGALDRSAFNRDVASEGGQTGNAESV
jgi:hypothetical protein